MQFSLTVAALLASGVAAQSVGSIVAQIPACALTCLTTSAAAAGCPAGDYACECGDKRAEITTSATPCVLGGCPPADAVKVLGLVDQLCSAVLSGGGAGGSSSAAQASTTSTILLTTTTTEPSTTAATTTVVDTTVSTSVVSTSVVPATNTTSVIGTGSMMPSVTKTPSPTATPPIQVNGASQFHVGMSLMGAVLVGALAL